MKVLNVGTREADSTIDDKPNRIEITANNQPVGSNTNEGYR
jgi:hypothetical protein